MNERYRTVKKQEDKKTKLLLACLCPEGYPPQRMVLAQQVKGDMTKVKGHIWSDALVILGNNAVILGLSQNLRGVGIRGYGFRHKAPATRGQAGMTVAERGYKAETSPACAPHRGMPVAGRRQGMTVARR
jgi:hypothetical protein